MAYYVSDIEDDQVLSETSYVCIQPDQVSSESESNFRVIPESEFLPETSNTEYEITVPSVSPGSPYEDPSVSLRSGVHLADMKDEDVVIYRTKVRYLVEELMEMVAQNNPLFSNYKILLSGSTNEMLKVGDPLEIDYLVQYDLHVDKLQSETLVGYAQLYPNKEDFSEDLLEPSGELASVRMMYSFVHAVLDVIESEAYKSKPLRLSYRLSREEIIAMYTMRLHGVGAAMDFNVHEEEEVLSDLRDLIDVVLSFRLPATWPECALGWKKYENKIEKKCFQDILDHGVSFVCKGPDPNLFPDFEYQKLFRFSFSFAESHLIAYMDDEKKEAFKLLKLLRVVELTNLKRIDMGFVNPAIEGTKYILGKALPSYCLKTVQYTMV